MIFALLGFGYWLAYFQRLSPAVIAVDMMRDLAMGATLTGLLAAAYFYPYAFMQIPAGLLADRLGPRKTVTFSCLLAAVASVLFGIANTPAAAVAARAFIGFGISMVFVPTMKILTQWFGASEFALAAGLLMAVGGLGSLSAAAPLAFLSTAVGWRLSFIAAGAVTGLLAVLVWLVVRDRPRSSEAPGPAQPSGAGEIVSALRQVALCGSFWLLALWFFFDGAIFFSFSGLWGGPYLMQAYGLDKVQAGQILSMVAVGLVLGSPALSYFSEKVLHSRKRVLVGSSAVVVLLAGALCLFPGSLPRPALYMWSFGLGFFSSAVVTVAFASTKEMFPLHLTGTATGFVNVFPFLGAAIMQPLLGAVLEALGGRGAVYGAATYGRAFGLYLACAVAALACALLTSETYGSAGAALRKKRGFDS